MANIIEILFPEDQQEGTEATVTRWLVAEGQSVAAHDPVVEIETDKVVVEVAAPAAGRIAEIRIRQDEAANPGDVLCTLETDGETIPRQEKKPRTETSANSATAQTLPQRLSPAVRRRISEHQLDISDITGSGSDGRITLQDVEALIAKLQPGTDKQTAAVAEKTTHEFEGSEIIPHDRMRKRIADHMVSSLMHTAPHVTAVFEGNICQGRRATDPDDLFCRSRHLRHPKSTAGK